MMRPFFDSGSVETAANRGAGGASALSEVEEEQEFERLVLKMRGTLSIKDRVQNRVPFFKVGLHSLGGVQGISFSMGSRRNRPLCHQAFGPIRHTLRVLLLETRRNFPGFDLKIRIWPRRTICTLVVSPTAFVH